MLPTKYYMYLFNYQEEVQFYPWIKYLGQDSLTRAVNQALKQWVIKKSI